METSCYMKIPDTTYESFSSVYPYLQRNIYSTNVDHKIEPSKNLMSGCGVLYNNVLFAFASDCVLLIRYTVGHRFHQEYNH